MVKIIKFKVDLGVDVSGSTSLVPDELIYPLDSRILFAPLNEDDYKCWLMFKQDFGWQRANDQSYAKCKTCDILKGDFLQLNHPVVRVVSNFAVAAFNKLFAMYVKKGEEENIYEADVTKVRFLPNDYGFSFFITLEALEENIAGVYEATVLCHCDDGRCTLINFTRSNNTVIGTKLIWKSRLVLENFVYETVKEQEKAIEEQLLLLGCNLNEDETIKSSNLYNSYKEVKGFNRVCSEFAHLVKPITWKIKRSDPGDWFVPNEMIGLHPRSGEHSCGSYDYQNPLEVFACYQ